MTDRTFEGSSVKEAPLWFHVRGLMQTASGFGSRLKTTYKVLDGKKWKRVYCICYSNVGSTYIITGGKREFVNVCPTQSKGDM